MEYLNYKNRLKWNKNNMINSVSYIKMYIKAIEVNVPIKDRQTLYVIAKFFTDGVEHARNNIELSNYYFKKGEAYFQDIPQEKTLLRKLVTNSYDRAKSYFYYKNNQLNESLECINNTLTINQELEQTGYPFLIFDRVSQYQNYAKILQFNGETSKAFEMLADLSLFLTVGKAKILTPLNTATSVIFNDEFTEMRTFLVNQLLFDTANIIENNYNNKLDTGSKTPSYIQLSESFYNHITSEIESIKLKSSNDKIIYEWLIIIKHYISGNKKEFQKFSKIFNEKFSDYHKGIPKKIIVSLNGN